MPRNQKTNEEEERMDRCILAARWKLCRQRYRESKDERWLDMFEASLQEHYRLWEAVRDGVPDSDLNEYFRLC